MCITNLDTKIPAEEYFQNIRWKVVKAEFYGTRQFFNFGFIYGGVFPIQARKGRLCFDENDHRVVINYTQIASGSYRCGFHYFKYPAEAEFMANRFSNAFVCPVLVADITATGTQHWTEKVLELHEGCARIMYFLTDKEYKYLMTDHKPIKIPSLELQENEL